VSRKARLAASLAVMAAIGTAALQLTGAASALASPTQGLATVVSMGDSFIAGEGGRFAGQADNPATDRGFGVYGNTVNWFDGGPIGHEGGCHRSDSAEVFGASPATFRRINLACSGAATVNVWRAATGGQSFKGEQPQADQLASVAAVNNVKAIVLSIGGNDLGFGQIVQNCVSADLLLGPACNIASDPQTRQNIGPMMNNISHAITDIRATMTAAGYQNSDYRLIVQSYPSPLPAQADFRPGSGCPFYAADVEWVNKVMVPRLAGAIRQVVRNSNTNTGFNNAQFMDVSNALRGHELCNKNTQFSTTAQPAQAVAEWANWINFTSGTNRTNESAHPNDFGQLALQQCFNLMIGVGGTGNFRCANAGPGQVSLSLQPLGDIWSSFAPAQVLKFNSTIPVGTCIWAATGAGALCFQTDGNLVNYRGSTAVWASGTQLTGGTARFQADGNIVITTSTNQVAWHSDSWGNPDSELVMLDSGFAAILNPAGTMLWLTGTTGGGGAPPPGGGGPPRHEN